MDATGYSCVLALLLSALAVSQAHVPQYNSLPRISRSNYLAFPRMGRSNYLALPRMGRSGYIAFPRMGRSYSGSDENGSDAECCMLGLKTEWVVEEGGKTSLEKVCGAEACCEGFREIVDKKPSGSFYSMCIPEFSSARDKRSALKSTLGLH